MARKINKDGVCEAYFKVRKSKNGKFYYSVYALNHENIDGSQGYASRSNCRRALKRRYGIAFLAQEVKPKKAARA